MGFLDTLSNKTKALGDSAKLNIRINGEKRKIAEYIAKLGEITWNKYKTGFVVNDADILGVLVQLKAVYTNIDGMNAALDRIRTRSAESEKAGKAKKTEGGRPRDKQKCPRCGAEISGNQRFCSACRTKLPNDESTARLCPGCGTVLSEEQAFCPSCGKKCR